MARSVVPAALHELNPFTTPDGLGGERGKAVTIWGLPDEFVPSAHLADYVVYSHGVPVAWHLPAYLPACGDDGNSPGAWVIPDTGLYPPDVTAHRAVVLAALAAPDGPADIIPPAAPARRDGLLKRVRSLFQRDPFADTY